MNMKTTLREFTKTWKCDNGELIFPEGKFIAINGIGVDKIYLHPTQPNTVLVLFHFRGACNDGRPMNLDELHNCMELIPATEADMKRWVQELA